MYDELVKRLREPCQYENCILCQQAADAIEELGKDLERSKEWEEFWEKEANEALKKFQTTVARMPRWIPVTERLPIGGDDSGAICENVCLLMDDGTVSCGWMNGTTKKVYYLNARDDFIIKAPITRVTHWMPLPQPPKEG